MSKLQCNHILKIHFNVLGERETARPPDLWVGHERQNYRQAHRTLEKESAAWGQGTSLKGQMERKQTEEGHFKTVRDTTGGHRAATDNGGEGGAWQAPRGE